MYRRRYNKRRYRRKTLFRSRRIYRRYKRYKKTADKKVYSFQRTIRKNDIVGPIDGALPEERTYGNIQFYLSDLPNYGEFQNLYDQYKITGVKIKFYPPGLNFSQPRSNGEFYYFMDENDGNAPTSMTQIYERQNYNVKSLNDGKPFKVFIRPAVSAAYYQSAGLTSYGPKRAWLDTTSPNVPHWALKWAWDQEPNAQASALYMHVVCTYYLKFKNVK